MNHADISLVHRQVERQARLRPAALAAADARCEVSYRELDLRANQVAHLLLARGIGPEDLVGLLLDRSVELLTGFLGILKAGAAAVLLDPSHPVARLRQVLALTAPRALLSADRLAVAAAGGPGMPAIALDDRAVLEQAAATAPGVAVHPDGLAYVVHTSGSTGAPKRVGVTHRSVAHSLRTHRDGHRVVPADRASWLSPPGSSVSVGELWPYLSSGASVHAAPPPVVESPPDLRDWLVAQQITTCYLSMPLAELVTTLEWPADCALRLVTVGSDQVRRWAPATLPFEVAVGYGSSEANGVTSCLVPWRDRLTSGTASERDRAGLPPIGRPWPDVRTYLLDPRHRPVAEGAVGELWVAGPELARGYLRDPGRTADRFRPDPHGPPGARMYRTGDLARHRPDGWWEHHGRVDREIKIRGFRVHPAEVEAELLRLAGVRDAVVVAVDDDARGRVLAAYLVAGPELAAGGLPDLLAERLPAALVPAAFTVLDRLPTGTNGKVDRSALPPPDWSTTGARYRPATDPVEHCLVAAFAEVLQRDRVGVDDNFFHLGGDSLTGSQLTLRLRERFDQRIPLRVVFRHPTARALAAHLREAGVGLVGGAA